MNNRTLTSTKLRDKILKKWAVENGFDFSKVVVEMQDFNLQRYISYRFLSRMYFSFKSVLFYSLYALEIHQIF